MMSSAISQYDETRKMKVNGPIQIMAIPYWQSLGFT